MEVGKTILQQLGGARIAIFLGVKHFVGVPNGLQFRWTARGKESIQAVRVTLEPSDTYKVEFFGRYVADTTPKKIFSDVYAEDLMRIFEQTTGLYLHF